MKASVNMGRQRLCTISATVQCQRERLNTTEKKVSIIQSIKNQDVQTKAIFRGKIIGSDLIFDDLLNENISLADMKGSDCKGNSNNQSI